MIKIENQIFKQDDLRTAEYVGEIVDINDPKKIGRCRIRVYGKYDELADSELPWAYPQHKLVFASKNGGSGAFSTPKLGIQVAVTFFNGNLYTPIYSNILVNSQVSNEVSESYENAHLITYDLDEDLKIYYTQKKGLNLNLKGSSISINPDKSVLVKAMGSEIELTKDGRVRVANQSESLKQLLKELISEISKLDIVTPAGKGLVGPKSVTKLMKLQIRILKLLK